MLIQEKIRQTKFTPAEEQVIHFLKNNIEHIHEFSIRIAAKKCYTYPSTLVRVAKKLGFSGWSALKQAYCEEVRYTEHNFKDVDANFPFTQTDSLSTVAVKMSVLTTETINDTLALLHHDQLYKAVHMIEKANIIRIFARNHNLILAQEFALRMNRIGYQTYVSNLSGEHLYDAANTKPDSCALFITYSGESQSLEKAASLLKAKNVPILLLTSIGNNSLSNYADCLLYLSTREKLYSKIGNFSVMTSIAHLLNILYAGCFSKNFQRNYQHLFAISLVADNRKSSVSLIKETEEPS